MSLSNPKLQNPCKKHIEFKGGDGEFRYWDKDFKKNITLKFPLRFVVLDELNCVRGFNDQTKSGIFSNEVHSLKNQDLVVRTYKGGLRLDGKYHELKPQIDSMGGKFCKSVYAALMTDEGLELVNFQLSGAAFKSWMDKKVNLSKQLVVVSECLTSKKGKVTYKMPIWVGEDMPQDLLDEAISMDKALQDYLSSKKQVEVADATETDEEQPEMSDEDKVF